MSVIVYKKYSFKIPPPINQEQYTHIKHHLAGNGVFEEVISFDKTFTSHFKKSLRWMAIGLGIMILSIFVYQFFYHRTFGQHGTAETILIVGMIAGGIVASFTIFQIMLEGPSMATFLTDKKYYYTRMKYAIRSSYNYSSFYHSFYDRPMTGAEAAYHQEAHKELKTERITFDLALTRLFNLIDKHFYKVILAIVAILLLKKYVF